MRKLASIQTIDDLLPIEGKDRIQSARVLGWNVIVTKDFDVGDKVVYIEIDSVLPEKPEFEFLRPRNFRIRTIKMAGTISQGICFPLDILPPGEYHIGDDVTEILGIKQYEPGIDDGVQQQPTKKTNKIHQFLMRFRIFRKLFVSNKCSKDSFPVDLASKTDETRIQAVPWMLDDNKLRYVFTEKIDGTSGTFILHKKKSIFGNKYKFYVCSRNRRLLKDDGSVYWRVANAYHMESVLTNLFHKFNTKSTVCIQGEIIAPTVQQNKYNVKEPIMYVFNLIVDGDRKPSVDAKRIVETCGLQFVPIVKKDVCLHDDVRDVDTMIRLAHGQSAIGDTLREGLVVRSEDGQRSFKAVDPLFLLKYNE